MRYWLVMPAAGAGRRFGESVPKQYAPLCGRTVIEWALAPFAADSRCAGIAIAIAEGDPHWADVSKRLGWMIRVAHGGQQRSESVRSALAALADVARANDWVLVHDAARPCVSREEIDRLIAKLEAHPPGGLLALPAADTLKRARSDGAVDVTVDRSNLWRALTPQMFRYARLCEALDAAHRSGRYPTDEAQALEWCGESPLLVEGASANIKITTAQDLTLAEALLRARSVE
ncbi:MAG TPA: 2-C-methyl-D-erythritol 4-phosphate cytidylyltransferase [Steroidobacteraceae bacterium]